MKGNISLRTLSLIVFNVIMLSLIFTNGWGYRNFPVIILNLILIVGNLGIVFLVKGEEE